MIFAIILRSFRQLGITSAWIGFYNAFTKTLGITFAVRLAVTDDTTLKASDITSLINQLYHFHVCLLSDCRSTPKIASCIRRRWVLKSAPM